MSLQDIVILVPSHSLEDFPTEQADKPASSLLNTFAVAWHPELLAWTGALPRWRRADEPSALHSGQLIFVPTVCDDWLPHGWVDDARAAGATVVSGLHERAEIAAAAVAALPERYDIATDLVDDFFSLGLVAGRTADAAHAELRQHRRTAASATSRRRREGRVGQ